MSALRLGRRDDDEMIEKRKMSLLRLGRRSHEDDDQSVKRSMNLLRLG